MQVCRLQKRPPCCPLDGWARPPLKYMFLSRTNVYCAHEPNIRMNISIPLMLTSYVYVHISHSSPRTLLAHPDAPIRLSGQHLDGFQFLVNVFSILWITRCFPVFVETAAGGYRHIFAETAVLGFTEMSAFSSLTVSEAPFAEWAEGGGFRSIGIF